jgi:hypothetical protein
MKSPDISILAEEFLAEVIAWALPVVGARGVLPDGAPRRPGLPMA